MSSPQLLVFGCGHVGSALVYAAAPLGFRIVGIDEDRENASKERLPPAELLVNSFDDADLDALPFGDDTYVVIATRDHGLDQRLLEYCLKKDWRYLGCIGSARKAAVQRERLLAKGFSARQIEKLRCPIGLDVGAQTPEEIAVSICAELIAFRRGHDAG